MTFIEELKSRPDLIKDHQNIKNGRRKITVFERISNDNELQEKLRVLREKQK